MQCLRLYTGDYYFTEDETKVIEETAGDLIEIIKEKDLTYAAAFAALEQCKILIESSLVK